MKRLLVLIAFLLLLTGCASALESAKNSVDKYNEELVVYSQKIADYNNAAKERNESIIALTKELNSSQEAINRNETPFDETTLSELKDAIVKGNEALVSEVEVIPEYNPLSVSESMSDEELKTIKKQADQDLKAMKNVSVPELPESVDYSDVLSVLQRAHKAYENSITSLKQITAPSDDFVMSRLQRIDTILGMEAVTEDHDPNGHLNKAGGYIGTIYFRDSRIKEADLYLFGDETIIDIGTDGGGAIEIYPNVEDAESRNAYLGAFDGSALKVGSHVVYGTIVIRTSDYLTASQQKELTEKILNALIAVDD